MSGIPNSPSFSNSLLELLWLSSSPYTVGPVRPMCVLGECPQSLKTLGGLRLFVVFGDQKLGMDHREGKENKDVKINVGRWTLLIPYGGG
ncbi:hypothetical protein E2C01_056856 [Portunus trituberculatus]|uniref:Uncharacterized protein n=1 Tax=Portunus trituberculatus TaxID=210409 RepID=A0A5B7GYU0_PORTR|nr:hypothetical protein [Portunus trituberculatus]